MQMTPHCKMRPVACLWRPILFLFFCATAVSFPANSQALRFSFKQTPLENIFREIEKQTAYRFIYAREELKDTRPVTMEFSGNGIDNMLAVLFRDQQLTYTLNKNYISVFRKEEKQSEKQTVSAATIPFSVKGRVTSETGEPLSRASIIVQQSNIATATDEAGNFELNNIDKGAVLSVSSIGYLQKEIFLAGRTALDIKLSVAVNALDETIVIAYGTTTRRLTTGSVSKVTSQDISKQPVNNPLAALEGRVPGLFISQVSGNPGGRFKVQLRGQNSIQNGNSPLFIIDGVPFLGDGDLLVQRSTIDASNPFHSLNPDNIESIEVLKDGDATAIYGSRGANGVILITTKKGKTGKPSLEVNTYWGWQHIAQNARFLNTEQYIRMRREAFGNDGAVASLVNAPDLLVWDTTRYTNWKKMLIGGTARVQNTQVRFRGGQGQITYNLGANYNRESTVFPGEAAVNRIAVDQSIDFSTNNRKFTSQLSSSYSHDRSNLFREDLTAYSGLPPNAYSPYDSSGRLVWREGGTSVGNPLAILQQPNNGVTDRLTANWTFSYLFLKNLQFKLSSGYNSIVFEETSYIPISAQDPALNPKGASRIGNSLLRTWIVEPQLHYKRNWGVKHNLSLVAGSSLQETVQKSTLIEGLNYTSDDLLQSVASAPLIQAKNGYTAYHYAAVFGRLHYDYEGMYILNITGRRDGSSRFGAGKQFANFGALGAGYVFSNHRLLQTKLSFLSFGKLRASYGITGNDQIGNYQYLDTWSGTQYAYQGAPSLRPTRIFNPDYSWEKNRKLEVGLDLGFLKDRLLVSADYFLNRSDNQIIRYPLPGQTGFREVLLNFPGVVQNKGWEVSVTNTNLVGKDWSWSTGINVSANRNQLRSFPGLELSSYASDYVIGQPLNIRKGYHFTGVDPQTGIYAFEDRNKDGQINSGDYYFYGTTNPDYFGGIQNSVKYKNFQLDLLFQFVKQKGLDLRYISLSSAGTSLANQSVLVGPHWQRPGDIQPYQQYTQSSTSPASLASFKATTSDATLTDASFVRLKSFSIIYSLSAWVKKLKIESASIYMQGQNLFTFTSYQGADPEMQTAYQLPLLRVLTLGMKFNF